MGSRFLVRQILSPSHYTDPGILARDSHPVYVQVFLALAPSGCVLSILPVESRSDIRGASDCLDDMAVNISPNGAWPGYASGSVGLYMRCAILCLATAMDNCLFEKDHLSHSKGIERDGVSWKGVA